MSILGTGRANLAQADQANKASTGLANARAASNAGITISEQNAKKSMRGQALGAAGTLGLAAYGATPTVGAGTAAASGLAPAGAANVLGGGAAQLGTGNAIVNATTASPAVTSALGGSASGIAPASVNGSISSAFDAQLANTSTMQSATALNSGGLGASGVGTGVAEGGGTAAADAAAAALAESTAAGAGGAAAGAGGAAASTTLAATASAAIPFVGWAAAAGMLAYSLFG